MRNFFTIFFLFNKFPICLTGKISMKSCRKNRNKKLRKLKTKENCKKLVLAMGNLRKIELRSVRK